MKEEPKTAIAYLLFGLSICAFITFMFWAGIGEADAAALKVSELSTAPITALSTNDKLLVSDTSSPQSIAYLVDEWDKKYYNTSNAPTIPSGQVFTVTSTAYVKKGFVLVSPDASCSACGVDNGDTFSCTATACP